MVVVNWNRVALLRECLESLRAQQDSCFEIIIVDNGSTDGSLQFISQFASSAAFPVRVIQNSENHGFCAANNQGIRVANGKYIALLNNDARAEPQWLAALVRALDERPEFGMAASKILVAGRDRVIDKVGHLIYPDGQNRGRGSGELDRGQYDAVEEVLWPDGCAALYRKSMLDETGAFDEDFFAYADDAELGLRARLAGWKSIYVPTAVVYHHRGSTLGLFSSRRLQLIERNRIWLAVLHFPLRLLVWNWFYFGLRIAGGTWASLRGRGEAGRFPGAGGKVRMAAALLSGTWHGWRQAPAMWRKRRELQRLRRLSTSETLALLRHYKIGLKEISEQSV